MIVNLIRLSFFSIISNPHYGKKKKRKKEEKYIVDI